jgi:hypothetical protein
MGNAIPAECRRVTRIAFLASSRLTVGQTSLSCSISPSSTLGAIFECPESVANEAVRGDNADDDGSGCLLPAKLPGLRPESMRDNNGGNLIFLCSPATFQVRWILSSWPPSVSSFSNYVRLVYKQ